MLPLLVSCWCPFLDMLQLLVSRWCPFLDMLQLLVLYNLQRSPDVHPGYHPVYAVVHWQMQSVGWPLCASSYYYSVHLDSQLCLWDWNYAVVKNQSQFQRSEQSHMICVTKMSVETTWEVSMVTVSKDKNNPTLFAFAEGEVVAAVWMKSTVRVVETEWFHSACVCRRWE